MATVANTYSRRRPSRRRKQAAAIRLLVVAGLALAVAAGLAAALTLLPPEVHSTAARVWTGIGLFGITVACLGAIAAYVMHGLARKSLATSPERVATTTTVPIWPLALTSPDDATRYAAEWSAHLHERIQEGEIKQARRDRRRLIIAAVTLAVALRVRRALGRTH